MNHSIKCGRVPFDQKFRFEFPQFSYVEWNGIFNQAGPISFFSRSEYISHQELLEKMLKDRDEVVVLSAVSCFMWRSSTRIQNSTVPLYLYERNLRPFLAGEYANQAN